MSKEELTNLVRKIQTAEGTEEELDKMISTFEESVLDPNAVDYIFSKAFEDLSAEEIVEKILSFEPAKLPDEQK